jgi:transcriptional regulator
MLIHPWDAGTGEDEWRQWLADGRDFGQLVAVDPDRRPVIVPTHFVLDHDRVLIHLARPNPIWRALESDPHCVLTVIGDYAYIPGPWRATGDSPTSNGVPTSYYASVQISATAELIDDPMAKAALLRRQMAHFQPDGATAPISASEPPFNRMLPGLRGMILHVESVAAKFKYDDNKAQEAQRSVLRRLRERDTPGDQEAAAQQLRRARMR